MQTYACHAAFFLIENYAKNLIDILTIYAILMLPEDEIRLQAV